MSEKLRLVTDAAEESQENREAELLRLKNHAQILLIQYQIKKGIIKSAAEYAENGTAEFFELIADGHVVFKGWEDARKRAMEIIGEEKQLFNKKLLTFK